MDQGLDAIRIAVKLTPDESSSRRQRVSILAVTLAAGYSITDASELLDEALVASQEEMDRTPQDDPERAECLSRFGLIQILWILNHGDLESIDRAVRALKEALDRTPSDDPERSDRLATYLVGVTIRSSFMQGDDGVEEAIRLSRDEVTASSSTEGSLDSDLMVLYFVTELLSLQYRKTGDLSNLDEAIATQRRAIEMWPDSQDLDFAPVLAWTLAARYRHSGDSAALDEAISLYRQAIRRPPGEREIHATYWSGLGWTLQLLFERNGDPAVIEEAATAHRRAVTLSPVNDYNHGITWTNLGDTLLAKHGMDDSPEILEEAIGAYRNALATIPATHYERSEVLASLGRSLYEQSRTSGPASVDEAITVFEEALATSSLERPNRPEYALGLASALMSRYRSSGIAEDRDKAMLVLSKTAQATTGVPWLRLAAFRRLGEISAQSGQWDDAIPAFSAAVDLLPLIAPIHLRRADQEYTLAQWPGVASDAAACVLRQSPAAEEMALRLLERGRGILVSHALKSGSVLSWLRDRDPALAARLEWLYRELSPESHAPAVPPPDSGNQAAQLMQAHSSDRPHFLGRELSIVQSQVSDLAETDRYVAEPSMEDLRSVAADGPVVTINVSDYGSDALILTADGVEIVRLADVTATAVKEHVVAFLDAQSAAWDSGRPGARREAEESVSATLGWLWDSVCGPVLDRLGFRREVTSAGGPRVWWLPTGLLSFLPLHAAGHHDQRGKPEPPTVMDRVISSYTPTLRSLLLNRGKKTTPGFRRMLAVAVPDSPGHAHLPGVNFEITRIKERFPEATVLQGADARHDEILAGLPDSNWAHFACHALADLVSPSASSLIAEDHPISVLEISNLHIPHGEFAYLSACGTTRGSIALADEAIHLTGAFQLAGYTHVVGTLWPVDDDISMTIADHIYGAVSLVGVPAIAPALHEVVRGLRDNYPRLPSLWASHVHVGP